MNDIENGARKLNTYSLDLTGVVLGISYDMKRAARLNSRDCNSECLRMLVSSAAPLGGWHVCGVVQTRGSWVNEPKKQIIRRSVIALARKMRVNTSISLRDRPRQNSDPMPLNCCINHDSKHV